MIVYIVREAIWDYYDHHRCWHKVDSNICNVFANKEKAYQIAFEKTLHKFYEDRFCPKDDFVYEALIEDLNEIFTYEKNVTYTVEQRVAIMEKFQKWKCVLFDVVEMEVE